MNNIKEKVDEIIKWEKLKAEATAHLNALKAEFLEAGVAALETSKDKTINYTGSDGNRVQVQEVEKIDTMSTEGVKRILGNAANEYVSESVKYDISSKLIKIITPLVTGKYEEGSVLSILEVLTDDSKKLATLKKKIKGSFKKDIIHLQTILDMPEEKAKECAFKLEEVSNYEKLITFVKAVKSDTVTTEEYLTEIKNLFFVEENVKVALDYEK